MGKNFITALFFLILSFFNPRAFLSAAPQRFEIPVPTAKTLLSKLIRKHPRIIAQERDFKRIKELISKDRKVSNFWKRILRSCKSILSQPPSEYRIPDGLRLLGTSRRVLGRVYALCMAYRVTGKERYAKRAYQELKKAASFPDWNPRHFLDTAEMSHAFAIGYDWLYDFLKESEKKLLLEALKEKGFLPGIRSYRGQERYGWWTRAHHNWNQVCNGGLGIAALAVADKEPALAGEILTNAIASIQRPSRWYAPDGAWVEGPGYWNYATFYHVCFLAALESSLGTDLGLSKAPGFSRTGIFPIAVTGPTGLSFNFADAHAGRIRAPQLFWFAQKFSLPVCAWYEANWARAHPLDLVWYSPEQKSPRESALPLGFYFRNAEVVTLRSRWEDPNALFIGFKGGSNSVNHSHLDLGSFVLEAKGARWAIDLGSDNYNLPGYFGGNRWKYYRLRAEGHNTLVIGPGKGPDQDPRGIAKITAFEGKGPILFAICDLTDAYRPKAKSVKRGVALGKKGFLIQDEIKLKKAEDVWWFLHTEARVKISPNARRATLAQNGKTLEVRLLEPKGALFKLMKAQPLPSSPNPPGQRRNERVRKLAINLKGISSSTIAVQLSPGSPAIRESYEVKPLKQWQALNR